MQQANAQGTPTAPQQTTIQGASSGNLEFLKQKAYVYTLPPQGENIPQGSAFGAVGDQGGILGMVTGALGIGTAIYSKLTSSTKKTGQDNATNTAQLATVSKEGLKLQYETMGTEKANAINGKPEIKLDNVKKIEDKALETAAKA